MANRRFTQFFYTFHKQTVQLDLQFIVDADDAAGFGVTDFYGPGVQSVLMKTSGTPAGAVNPDTGIINVSLQDNYSRLLGFEWSAAPTVTGSPINISDSTVMTVGRPYQITTLGTTTAAQWVTAGVPVGTTPAVGVVYMSAITGAGTGTGTVTAIGVTNFNQIALVGANASQAIGSSKAAIAGLSDGSYLLFKILGPTNSSTTTPIPVAPTDGIQIYMKLLFNNSKFGV